MTSFILYLQILSDNFVHLNEQVSAYWIGYNSNSVDTAILDSLEDVNQSLNFQLFNCIVYGNECASSSTTIAIVCKLPQIN